jgi:hypothetical protein
VNRIERETGAKIKPATLPTPDTVMKMKVGKLLTGFVPAEGANQNAISAIQGTLSDTGWSEAIASMSKEEIVARFLARNIKIVEAPKPEGKKGNFHSKKSGFKSFGPKRHSRERGAPSGHFKA